MTINDTQTHPTRQERLRLWLYTNGKTLGMLSAHMGITRPSVHRLLYGESMPPERHASCVSFGIPVDLLPPAKFIPTGRKPLLLKMEQAHA